MQPAGALLALLCAVAAIVGGYAAVTGLAVTRLLGPLVRGRVVLVAIAVVLAGLGLHRVALHPGRRLSRYDSSPILGPA